MRMSEFIKQNRKELDRLIKKAMHDMDYRLNDGDRKDWILNDEGLYNWARREGVKV